MKKEHNQHSSVFKLLRQLLYYLNVTSIYNSNEFCLVVKRLIITKNSVVKIQNLVMNHELQPIKSNPDDTEKLCKFEEKLTYGLKKDTRNLANFHQST